MAAKTARLRHEVPARERILDAAAMRFAGHSYKDTSLRDIAADARVDVAYVHRCFGSKQRLFAEVVEHTVGPSAITEETSARDLVALLTQRLFSRATTASSDVDSLSVTIRSIADPEAAEVLRNFLRNRLLTLIARRGGAGAQKRAALAAAFIAGTMLFRNVIGLEELSEDQGGELEALVAEVLTTLLANHA